MPTSRATARSESPDEPCSSSCRRATSRISRESSSRTRARTVRGVPAIHPVCRPDGAMTTNESTALDSRPALGGLLLQNESSALNLISGGFDEQRTAVPGPGLVHPADLQPAGRWVG